MNSERLQNTWVETGEPVTLEDAKQHDLSYTEEVKRLLERDSKKDFSQRKAQQKDKDKLIRPVQLEIEAKIAEQDAKPKGTDKKEWYAEITKCDTYVLAEYAVARTQDAAHNGWSKRKLEEELGKCVGMAVFTAIFQHNANSRRRFDRMDMAATKIEGYDGPGRAERILQFAEKYGYDTEKWREATYQAKHGAVLMTATLKALASRFKMPLEKRTGDTHTRYYIEFIDEIDDEERIAEFSDTEEQRLSEEAEKYAASVTFYNPIVVPPRPWNKDNLGPFPDKAKAQSVPFVRNMGDAQRQVVQNSMRDGRLDNVTKAVNAIQETPFMVNRYVYDALKWVFEDIDQKKDFHTEIGREINGLPNTRRIRGLKKEKMAREKFNALPRKEQRIVARAYANKQKHNLRAKGAFKRIGSILAQAENTFNTAKFWLPHNLDYRGRVYHVPSFGPHNADFVRALFEFADKEEVTPENEWFIKLQIANHAGQDKLTLKERIKWVDDNEADIIASGLDYKSTVDFWGKQDSDSFQFLAACRDWAMYTEAKKAGVPYFSGLPIAFDATQSGVQHYGAATKSSEIARKVNITPAAHEDERPADFYTLCLHKAVSMLKTELEANRQKAEDNPISEKEQLAIDDFEAHMDSDELIDDILDDGERVFKVVNRENPKLPKEEVSFAELTDMQKREERDRERKRIRAAFKRTKTSKKLENIKNVKAAEVALELHENPIIFEGETVASYGRAQIKRNGMTLCYSSEEYGFAEQLLEDWMDDLTMLVFEGKLKEHPFGVDEGFHAATYLAKIHYNAIASEVLPAVEGMKFFKDIARIMANDVAGRSDGVGKHVHFTNRLHFPMFQNYREHERRKQKVLGLDNETLEYNPDAESSYTYYKNTIDTEDSVDGIAPNLIHQQDSLHLMLTVLDCVGEGVTNFMMIHDSFATTIGSADTLSACLRRMFILLYDDYNLFEDVLAQSKAAHSDPENKGIQARYDEANKKLEEAIEADADAKTIKRLEGEAMMIARQFVGWPVPPKQGDLDLKVVWDSDYFFN